MRGITSNAIMAIMSMMATFQKLQSKVDEQLNLAIAEVTSWDVWPDFDESTTAGKIAAQTTTVIQGVVIVVVAMIGIVIVTQVDSSVGNISNSDLNGSKNNLLSDFGSMMDLVGPLLIVLIAVVIIAVVQRIRQ